MAEFDIVAQKNTYEALLEKSLSSSIPRQTDLKISKLVLQHFNVASASLILFFISVLVEPDFKVIVAI
jgi:hypothetical protein